MDSHNPCAAILRLREQPSLPQKVNGEPNSEWLQARHNYITSSDAASYLTAKEKGRNTLVYRKSLHEMAFTTAAMMYGSKMESEVIKMYEERMGESVEHFGLIVSEKAPFLAGSPDGVTRRGGILVEVKCHMSIEQYNLDNARHYHQVQALLYCLDLPSAHLVRALIKEPIRNGLVSSFETATIEEFKVHLVNRNQNWPAVHLPDLKNFYDSVMKTRHRIDANI